MEELSRKDRLVLIASRARNAAFLAERLCERMNEGDASLQGELGADLRAALDHFDAIEWPEVAPTESESPLYRGYHIRPGSDAHRCGWSFYHDAYDGADIEPGVGTNDHRHGDGTSEADCKAQIDEQYIEFDLNDDGSYWRY